MLRLPSRHSALGKRVLSASFWNLMGTGIARALALLASIVSARLLGVGGYGELGIIQSTMGLFGVFAGLGMGMTATKHIAEFLQSDPERAARILSLTRVIALGFSGLVGVVLWLLAPWLARDMLAAAHLSGLLQWSVLLLVFTALDGAQNGALAGFEAFKSMTVLNTIKGLINFPLTLLGVWLWGLPGIVGALILSAGLGVLLNHWLLRRVARRHDIPLFVGNIWQEHEVVWRFSLPLLISGSMVGPVNWYCNTLLVNQPDGYAQMGLFNAASQWRFALMFIPVMALNSLLPILSQLRGNEEYGRYMKLLRLSFYACTGLTLLMVIPAVMLNETLAGMYGPSFRQEHGVFLLMFLSVIPMAINSLYGHFNKSMNQIWWGTCLNALWALALVSFSLHLVSLGAAGLALANLLAYMLLMLVSFLSAWLRIRRTPALSGRPAG